jgi:LysM repeat protein
MSANQMLAQLQKWGVKYRPYKDWRNHNRNHKGAWGPVNGFMVHHTGSDSDDQRALLYNGTADLPGPLCHFGLAQDGTVWLIGWGRANHAGSGDDDVLRAVIDEKPIPHDDESNTDFNSRFYGVEIWYNGNHRMSDAQYETLLKLAAAICDFHGWGKYSVIGHGESGSPGKWDPGYAPGHMMDMDPVRDDVQALLDKEDKPATPQKPSQPKPAGDTYTVLAGDTLSSIGKKLKVAWEGLAKENGLKAPYSIKPGQKLKVPGKSTAPKPAVSYEPFPGDAYFKRRPKGSLIERMGKRLEEEGYKGYDRGPGPQWTDADREAFSWWQKEYSRRHKLGWSGSAVDGWPGKTSWDALKVPKR